MVVKPKAESPAVQTWEDDDISGSDVAKNIGLTVVDITTDNIPVVTNIKSVIYLGWHLWNGQYGEAAWDAAGIIGGQFSKGLRRAWNLGNAALDARKVARGVRSVDELRAARGGGAVGGKITGYTKHGLEQAIGRDGGKGVHPGAILDAVRNPTKVIEQAGGTTKYVGKALCANVGETPARLR
jgi:hypothetical protein